MNHWSVVLAAATLLTLERLCYVAIWRRRKTFRNACTRPPVGRPLDPVAVIAWLFAAFKGLQVCVFIWWCTVFGEGVLWPPSTSAAAGMIGGALLVSGQLLNLAVFRRLGRTGAFYGRADC
jgi:hypothetical protein